MPVPIFLKDTLWDGALPQDLAGLDWNFVRYLREEALERFLKTGLPSVKEEDWHYTNLANIEKTPWRRVVGTSNIQDTIPSLAADNNIARALFVDGYHSTAHTRLKRLPPGLRLTSLQEALQERNEKAHAFLQSGPPNESWHDLNMALFDDGLLVEVDAGVKIDKPLEIVFLGSPSDAPATYHTRLMFDLGENSSLDVVELRQSRGAGQADRFVTSISSARLGAGARLRQTSVVDGSAHAIVLFHKRVDLAARASCELNLLDLDGHLVRESVEIHHAGEEARSSLKAINIANGRHIDLLTHMKHEAPNTQSKQDVRALARNKGHSVFQGKVTVNKDAQKTDAQQMHRGLLLSEDAECDAKPSLEIFADDVKCGHGSTCGALDDEALFYMQSRGVPRAEAEKMLLEAFVLGLFEESDLPARENTLELLQQKLARGI